MNWTRKMILIALVKQGLWRFAFARVSLLHKEIVSKCAVPSPG